MTVDNKQNVNEVKDESSASEKKKKSSLFNSKFFTKLKSIKHIEIYLAVLLGGIILLIYLSTFSGGKKEGDIATSPEIEYTSITAYIKETQNNLAAVLSKINGAGEVDVFILYESGIELVIAYATETKEVTTGSGSNLTTTVTVVKTPILTNGGSQPIILSEILPKPKSILVVASGAKDVKIKLDLLMAVQTLFSMPSSSIEILAGK